MFRGVQSLHRAEASKQQWPINTIVRTTWVGEMRVEARWRVGVWSAREYWDGLCVGGVAVQATRAQSRVSDVLSDVARGLSRSQTLGHSTSRTPHLPPSSSCAPANVKPKRCVAQQRLR